MELKAGNWTLRPWRLGDEAALVKYANNRNIWINLRDAFPHPYTASDATEWVQSQKDQNPVLDFAIANEREAIGGIGLTPGVNEYMRSAEIGYWLGEPFWGKGIATEAVRALVKYAFANFDFVRLHAVVKEWNPASMRVLEKCGFQLEGRLRKSIVKDGQTIDQLLYAIVKD